MNGRPIPRTKLDDRRLRRLRELARAERRAERELDAAIARARRAGYSTRQIADAIGRDHTTLWRRHA